MEASARWWKEPKDVSYLFSVRFLLEHTAFGTPRAGLGIEHTLTVTTTGLQVHMPSPSTGSTGALMLMTVTLALGCIACAVAAQAARGTTADTDRDGIPDA